MNRTFKGFLKAYCAELANERTTSLRRLVAACNEHPRVTEPLFLLALEEDKLPYLLSLSKGTSVHDEFETMANLANGLTDAQAFASLPLAPKRYAAVLDAYREPEDLLAADRRINGLMRERTLSALETAGVTRWRLCRMLGLNPGNTYAYLSGDNSKVSRATARRIMEAALELAESA